LRISPNRQEEERENAIWDSASAMQEL